MKVLGLALLTLTAVASAATTPVYECVDGTRYLRIYAGPGAAYRGYHKSFAYPGKQMRGYSIDQYRCIKTNRSNFKCTKGDYILETYVYKGQNRHVTVSLAGDFGPTDSGYLHQLVCDRNN